MLEQLDLQPGQNVLQIGAGSGYTAALMQHLVGDRGIVTAVEIDRTTADQAKDNLQRAMKGAVHIVEADGMHGYSPRAGYDRILVNATIWDVPDAWIRQLKPDGVLVTPIWLDALQYCAAFHPLDNALLFSERNYPSTFVPLRGGAEGPQMTVRIGGSALSLTGNVTELDSASLHLLLSERADEDYLSPPLTGIARKRNFLPYMMLNLPVDYIFCLYTAEGDQLPYGMNQRGFAVLSRGSAVFVSLEGDFKAWVIGGSDAFIAAQETFVAWRTQRMPGDERLRLRLVDRDNVQAPATSYRVYTRTYHDLHAWQI
jgi:protein-L-isoaspartate O-methyltransferase